jgi:hypothetical protein
MGDENGGLGYSGEELTGMLIAGNDFNYVKTHAEAIASARLYNIVSCSSEALETAKVRADKCDAIDLLLGLERRDGHSLNDYKTFTSSMRHTLQQFVYGGGALIASGAYIASDMQEASEQQFLEKVLRCRYAGRATSDDNTIHGMGTTLTYWHQLNEEHYAATSADRLQPVKPAFAAMQYADGSDAAIASKSPSARVFIMGFPFECIQGAQKQSAIMQGILNYLLQ